MKIKKFSKRSKILIAIIIYIIVSLTIIILAENPELLYKILYKK